MTRAILTTLEEVARRRISAAKRILGPNAQTEQVATVVWAFIALEARTKRRGRTKLLPTNKVEKAAVNQLANALKRLHDALANPDLPSAIAKPVRIENLEDKMRRINEVALTKLGKPKRKASLKLEAADLAAQLMVLHGLKRTSTREGKFHKLAGIIYGDPDADLFNQCRKSLDYGWDS